jgi:predicted ATPase
MQTAGEIPAATAGTSRIATPVARAFDGNRRTEEKSMTYDEAIHELRVMSNQLITAKKPNTIDRIIHAIEDRAKCSPQRIGDFSDGELISECMRRGLH